MTTFHSKSKFSFRPRQEESQVDGEPGHVDGERTAREPRHVPANHDLSIKGNVKRDFKNG